MYSSLISHMFMYYSHEANSHIHGKSIVQTSVIFVTYFWRSLLRMRSCHQLNMPNVNAFRTVMNWTWNNLIVM